MVITSSRLANGTHIFSRLSNLSSLFIMQQSFATDISINKFDNGNLTWLNNQDIVEMSNPIKILKKDRFIAKYSSWLSSTAAIFNHEVENSSCTNPTRVHHSWSRVHGVNEMLNFHRSWTREWNAANELGHSDDELGHSAKSKLDKHHSPSGTCHQRLWQVTALTAHTLTTSIQCTQSLWVMLFVVCERA